VAFTDYITIISGIYFKIIDQDINVGITLLHVFL
jgi:hypothetical protein